ncbi:hypothetical protein JYT83_00260 [bacterium AH-315-F18]|nr:hypothetical protein [bacterium AH-315-F18]
MSVKLKPNLQTLRFLLTIAIVIVPTMVFAQAGGATAQDIEREATPILETFLNLLFQWGFRLAAAVVFLAGVAQFLRRHEIGPVASSTAVAAVLAFAPTFLNAVFK